MEFAKLKYDDCKYGCIEGKVFDPIVKAIIPCPHCSERRKELASEGLVEIENGSLCSLPTILGIDNPYLNNKFVYDSVIPDGERLFLEENSVKRQEDELNELYLSLGVGELPIRSLCIGLGNKGRIDTLAYPMLSKAYLAGILVGKFISCSEYCRMCINMSPDLERFYSCDFLMMLISDGSSKAEIASAKGLMQTRALKGKSTVFVTTWSIEACSILLGYYTDETFFMARGVFVEYKVSKGGGSHSKYINQLTGVENGISTDGETSNRGKSFTTMDSLGNM